jgi:hypothetical protein
LNHHLSAAGICAYYAGDTREAKVLLAVTSAKIMLIDIDRAFEPWLEILQEIHQSYPNAPKVVVTAREVDGARLQAGRGDCRHDRVPLFVRLLLAGAGYFLNWGAQGSSRTYRRRAEIRGAWRGFAIGGQGRCVIWVKSLVCFENFATLTLLPTPVRALPREGRSASSHSAIKASNWAKSNGFGGGV